MVVILIGAIIVSASITMLVLKKGGTLAMDAPDGRRKMHTQVTPRLGGLPIFLTLLAGFVVAALKFDGFFDRWWPLILANTLLFGVGFFDDVKPMGARMKLLGQFGCACILYASDISIDELSNPFGASHFNLGWWSFPITVFWLIAIPNIINLIDGMDGLATGFGLCMCLVLAFVGHFNLYGDVVLVAVIMSGALTGFLFFNLPPARIFLGDGGAYLIGFFIASVSLKSSNKGSVLGALLVMIVALGVPILDTLFAITRRALRGVPIFRADAEHIHHRLMTLGFSKTRALIALYSVCLALGLVGILVLVSKGRALPVVIAVLFLLALIAARYLGYVKSWSDVRNQLRGALAARQEMLYVASWGRIVEWEADKLESAEEFNTFLEHAVGRAGLHIKPQKGWVALPLLIAGGRVCHLYYDGKPEDQQRWLARADFFTSGINRALERWPDLSCVKTQEPMDESEGSALPA
jgi:UDP-GlcNAc:undecaprenyl-phosphate GlcNAc-1-phosphate transferase